MTDNLIGTTLWIAEAAPATNDAAGFEALTWVKVDGLQTAPVFGINHSNIPIEDLQSGFESGSKGMGSGEDSSGTHRHVDGDAGQEDLRNAANDPQGVCSLKKVIRGSGTGNEPATGDKVEYAHGYAHSFKDNQATGSNHEGFSYSFKQNAFTVYATEPA